MLLGFAGRARSRSYHTSALTGLQQSSHFALGAV